MPQFIICDRTFGNLLNAIFEAVYSFNQASSYMAKAFINDPESYIYPDLYINSSKFINPPVKIDFINSALLNSEESFKKAGFEVLHGNKLDSGEIQVFSGLAHFLKLSGIDLIDPEIIYTLYIRMLMIDFCFSEFNRDELDFKLIAHEFLTRDKIYTRRLLY
jgi:hypothetical protein